MMKRRKSEADKSIVVQVQSENSYQELFNYCSQFGKIRTAFHYKTPTGPNNFIILEFDDVLQYNSAVEHSCFVEDGTAVPVVSPFIWFKAINTKKARSRNGTTHDPPELITMENKFTNENLTDLLRDVETIDDQMKVLFTSSNLCDLGTRMRFIAAKQLETALQGLFPKVRAFPFGSSVNGFGKVGCDLDLILRLHPERSETPSDSRLIHHTKTGPLNERAQSQRQIEIIGDILHLFLPGTINIRRIIHARVPIIKYNHEYLNLDVDLSMTNLTGLYMSELLYIYGEMDERVRPLTFCIRKWASSTKLTNSTSPGRWITNFSLTLLVLFFLQCLRKPIVPSMNHLIALATKDDVRITDNHIHCTFARDLSKVNYQTKNTDSLSHLLIQFFEFYSQFDFSNQSVSLVEGKSSSKMDHSAMWIVNPFEPMMNVSKNVSLEELERFKFESKNAAWILESSQEKSTEDNFTLLNLFKSNRTNIVKPEMFFKSRLVDVSQIFERGEEGSPEIIFQNSSSRNEVSSIRQATKKQINKNSSRKSLKTR